MSALNLPIEQQKALAKEYGLSYEEWIAEMEADEKEIAEMDAKSKANYKPLTKAQLRQKIKAVQENPNGIHVYRRITGNDELTVADVVKAFEQQLETAPE